MEVAIFHEDAALDNMPQIMSFKKAYSREEGLCTYVMVADSSAAHNDPALIVIRVFLQKETKAKKYVMGTRFYSFGHFATVDIISLDCASHKDIIARHAERLGWPSIGGSDDFHIPLAFVGGFVEPDLTFVGSSGDYGNSFFGWSANDVARSVIAMINGQADAPDEFLGFMLNFMKKHKRHRDFYEQLYQKLLSHLPSDVSLHPQHLGALVTMKAWDRSVVERANFMQALVEENSGGLGSFIFLNNVAKKMKEAT